MSPDQRCWSEHKLVNQRPDLVYPSHAPLFNPISSRHLQYILYLERPEKFFLLKKKHAKIGLILFWQFCTISFVYDNFSLSELRKCLLRMPCTCNKHKLDRLLWMRVCSPGHKFLAGWETKVEFLIMWKQAKSILSLFLLQYMQCINPEYLRDCRCSGTAKLCNIIHDQSCDPCMARVSFPYARLGGKFPNYSTQRSIHTRTCWENSRM